MGFTVAYAETATAVAYAEVAEMSPGARMLSTLIPIIIMALIAVLVVYLVKKRNSPIKHTTRSRSKVVAALLAFFLGGTGAHRYYLGYKKQGIIQTCGFISLIIGYFTAILVDRIELQILAVLFLLYGAITSIWAFVDFIRILTSALIPEDGSDYTENRPTQVQVVQSAPSARDNADALEKLAKLREQGILTDDEFNTKKAEILAKM